MKGSMFGRFFFFSRIAFHAFLRAVQLMEREGILVLSKYRESWEVVESKHDGRLGKGGKRSRSPERKVAEERQRREREHGGGSEREREQRSAGDRERRRSPPLPRPARGQHGAPQDDERWGMA
jgi:hypothetical protein